MLSLHDAVEGGEKEEIKALLKAEDVNVNLQDEYGNTALHYAALSGDREIVRWLLPCGADINIPNKNQLLPIHQAIESCRPAVAWELLSSSQAGIDSSILKYTSLQMDKAIEDIDFPSHRADLYAAIHIGLHAFPQLADLRDEWVAFVSKIPNEDKKMILEHIDYADVLYTRFIPKSSRTLQFMALDALAKTECDIQCDEIYRLSSQGIDSTGWLKSKEGLRFCFEASLIDQIKKVIDPNPSTRNHLI